MTTDMVLLGVFAVAGGVFLVVVLLFALSLCQSAARGDEILRKRDDDE